MNRLRNDDLLNSEQRKKKKQIQLIMGFSDNEEENL